MNEGIKLAALSVFRSVLIAAGSYAVARGWIGQGDLEQVVGAVVVIAAAAWGAVDKLNKGETK